MNIIDVTAPHESRCTATAKGTGQRCRKRAVSGGTVCHKHGAAKGTPARRAADARVEQQRAEALATTFGLPRRVGAKQALLEELWRTVGVVDWLEHIVRELKPADVAWGKTKEAQVGASENPGTNITEQAGPNTWVLMYQQERDRLVRVAAAIEKLGLDQQALDLRREQVTVMVRLLRGTLIDAGLDPMEPRIFQIVQRRIAEIAHDNVIDVELA
jgi:hypothetical protein